MSARLPALFVICQSLFKFFRYIAAHLTMARIQSDRSIVAVLTFSRPSAGIFSIPLLS